MGVRLKRQFDEQTRDAILKSAKTGKRKILIAGSSAEELQKGLGERIRKARQEKGISQEDLAFLCGLDRSFVGSVERGERNISLINIYKIARGLDVAARDLIP